MSKPDKDGLTNMYMTLGQMDSALTSHIGDAEERRDGETAKELKHASARILEAQGHIRTTLQRLFGVD